MKRRKWTNESKAGIVLSGLRGQPLAEVCNEHGISQSQYYQWRDQFLSNAGKAFDDNKKPKEQMRITRENQRLKGLVGELTLELKKARSGYEAWKLQSSLCHKRPTGKQNS
jgi:transposase-like protein